MFGMGLTWEKFSSLPVKKTQKFETANLKPCFLFVCPQNKLKTIYVQAKEVPQIFVTVAYLVPKGIENLSELRVSSISLTS